jgi:outer membrane protein OmpA-like peptidoglycan-associated protein
MKYTIKLLLLLSCYFSFNKIYSQNLLSNGDFEIRTGNPTTWGQAYLLQSWTGIANGKWSPVTYFYEYDDVGYIPTWKEGGKQSPFSGHGFVGLGIAFKKVKETGSQYLETKLLKPLEKDSIYTITAFVSLADRVRYAIDYIPVALSDKKMLRNDGTPLYIPNLIKLRADISYLDNTTDWMKVSAKYKAVGGEYFFIIGGIEGNKKIDSGFKTKLMPFQPSFQYLFLRKLTYYFIDSISIRQQFNSKIEYKQSLTSTDSIQSKKVNKKRKIVLDDIAFEINSYKLKDTVNRQLNNLVSELSDCKACRVKITGYTDNIGTEKSNIKLSIMRAKTINEYLHAKGISYEAMEYEGLGESNPIANNDLSEGRLKNRRVEIQIIE